MSVLPQELSLDPSLLPGRNSARAARLLGHSSQMLERFLKEKGIGRITYLCPTSSTKQHSADNVIPALFSPPAAVVSFFPLPQCLSGKMLPVSFDGNSATQVKSLVLFSSFVVTATSEFNTAACFSAAVFAWQKIKELSTFLPYILLSGVYNLAGKMLTAEDQHSKSQCGGSLSFQLWEGKQYVIFITINRRLLWGFYFLDFFWYERFYHFKLSNWMY